MRKVCLCISRQRRLEQLNRDDIATKGLGLSMNKPFYLLCSQTNLDSNVYNYSIPYIFSIISFHYISHDLYI